ncbi:hypothetical protein vseg_015200 [Gypsophila vaccaria]
MIAVEVYVNAIYTSQKHPPKINKLIPSHYNYHLKFPNQLLSTLSYNPTAVRLLHCCNRTAVVSRIGGGLIMWPRDGAVGDACATAVTAAVALGLLRLWQETAKRGVFDQKLNRKLVHISIGLTFMLCWPLFSSAYRGAVLASLIPGINILRMLVIGSGIHKDEATIKSMSRFGDHRELLKGPLYYACAVTFACVYYWRTSPIGIGAICNLCAGDGFADIVGRRFGKQKLPYNKNKSFMGSIAMLTAAFLTSVLYMYYFSWFGYLPVSRDLVLGFFCMSIASTVVESLPISTEIDDNLTVSLTSFLIGSLFF